MNKHAAFLRIPLYLVSNVKDIDSFTGLSPLQQQRLPESYTPTELRQIVDAMRFALANPEYDLRPYAPAPGLSNDALRAFLTKVLASIPRELVGD